MCDSILIDENPVLRIPIVYTGAGIAVNGRHSSFELEAESCLRADAWTYQVTRSLNYEGIGA